MVFLNYYKEYDLKLSKLNMKLIAMIINQGLSKFAFKMLSKLLIMIDNILILLFG